MFCSWKVFRMLTEALKKLNLSLNILSDVFWIFISCKLFIFRGTPASSRLRGLRHLRLITGTWKLYFSWNSKTKIQDFSKIQDSFFYGQVRDCVTSESCTLPCGKKNYWNSIGTEVSSRHYQMLAKDELKKQKLFNLLCCLPLYKNVNTEYCFFLLNCKHGVEMAWVCL